MYCPYIAIKLKGLIMSKRLTVAAAFLALFTSGCSSSLQFDTSTLTKKDLTVQLTIASAENNEVVFDEVIDYEAGTALAPFMFSEISRNEIELCVNEDDFTDTTNCVNTVVKFDEHIILSGVLHKKNNLSVHLSVIRTITSPKKLALSGTQTSSRNMVLNNDDGVITKTIPITNNGNLSDLVFNSLLFKYQILN